MNVYHNDTRNISELHGKIFESIENFLNWADW